MGPAAVRDRRHPYPRPDAECSPERGHVHHDACRCDSTRKTIPGWEYQFTAALGHLRTAWAALIDVERTTPAGRTRQTARQVKNLLRRLHAAGNGGHGAPLVIMDAGYSAAALTAALTRQPVHLLIRLASGSVFYADPVTWPGKKGRPGKHGMPVTCHNNPGQANPEPDETLMLPDTPQYGTVRVSAWRGVHPLIHGDRGYFAGWDGDLPVLRGTVLRVIVERLPDGRAPPQDDVALARRARAAIPGRAVARLPGPLRRRTRLQVRQGHPRPDRRQGPHPPAGRPVGPPGHGRRRPTADRPAAHRRPAPPLGNPAPSRPGLTPGRVRRGFTNIRKLIGTPTHVAKHARPGPGRPKGPASGQAPRYPVPKKTGNTDKTDRPAAA